MHTMIPSAADPPSPSSSTHRRPPADPFGAVLHHLPDALYLLAMFPVLISAAVCVGIAVLLAGLLRTVPIAFDHAASAFRHTRLTAGAPREEDRAPPRRPHAPLHTG
jgi:hypothetical protein